MGNLSFKVGIGDLNDALTTISPCVGNGNDITSHFVFKSEEGTLKIYGWSGKVFGATPVVTNDLTDGSFTIEAKRLNLWLATLADDAVITFEMNDDNEVLGTAPRGKNIFQSLDPNNFPWFDGLFASCTKVCTITADLLKNALKHAGSWCYQEEHNHPNLAVVEARDGNFYSTDTVGASVVAVPGLEETNIRVHGKDVASILRFLSKMGDAEIQIFESDRSQFFVVEDGAIFGESRPQNAFPNLNIDIDDYSELWELGKEEVTSAVKFLTSGARWDDNRLYVTRNGDQVNFSMKSTSGKELVQEIGAKINKDSGADTYSFALSHNHLTRLIGLCEGDTVEVRCKEFSNTKGYILVSEETMPGFRKSTAITWLQTN